MPHSGCICGRGHAALPAASSSVSTTARVAAFVALLGIALLFAMVVISAVPAFWQEDGGGIFTWTWRPYQGHFGILPMICGSLLLAFSALLLGWPLALGMCCWMLAHPHSRCLTAVRGCVRLMAAVPTVVYGFAAIFLVTPLVRGGLGGSGFCWLAAAVLLALLALPTMILVMESSLTQRLDKLCPGGLAVGLSRMELLYFFVIPASRNALLAAALLGTGRALGDTLLPLMLAGNAPEVPTGLGDSMRSLTAHMALVTANEVGGAAYNSLFAAGAILLVVTAGVSLGLRRLQHSAAKGGAA